MHKTVHKSLEGLPGGSVMKNVPANSGTSGDSNLILGSRKIPWRRKWQSTPIFLLGLNPGTEEAGRLQSVHACVLSGVQFFATL